MGVDELNTLRWLTSSIRHLVQRLNIRFGVFVREIMWQTGKPDKHLVNRRGMLPGCESGNMANLEKFATVREDTPKEFQDGELFLTWHTSLKMVNVSSLGNCLQTVCKNLLAIPFTLML
ncbi:hypothetical protein, putative [Babesia ovata]|uniref:Uncharacterized protein n=1 Tax=Babesia ovata TaxID=189622 RepID=A0A2H6KK31_9APIC|nr:hypothetical protein, putative [Babesia ovata]GBE63347.1 hypothetical protein, putative [Babesia ovata]